MLEQWKESIFQYSTIPLPHLAYMEHVPYKNTVISTSYRNSDTLAGIKIGYQNYLKENLNYFDTFNLILAMAFYEKLSARIPELSPDDLFHVGATSRGTNSIYSTYINIKFLELSENSSFRRKYSNLFANFRVSKAVIEHIPGDRPALAFIARINEIASRLQKTPAKHEASRG
ncbi:MAG: hypothetical protein JRJ77_12640 [Deltaproteobacteria bacterium]|nr:hypothetical protein [Deltaproteobacteria bacterium]